MKKLLILLLLIVFGFAYWYYRLPNVIKRVRSSVVLVEVQRVSGQRIRGSGIVIKEGLILTAGHVIEDANDVCVRFDDGTKARSSEFFRLNRSDIVVVDVGLIIFDGDNDHLHFTQFKPLPGAKIFMVGSPYGLHNAVATGVLSRYNVIIQGEQLCQLDLATNPGMSGCPVFNRYGMVIGMIVRGSHCSLGFMIPANICQAVINIYENVEKIKIK